MPKDNSSVYIILGMLNKGRKSGYEIKKETGRISNHYYRINNNQIYPALKGLLQSGMVTQKTMKSENKPERKEYTITEKGREAFLRWLDQKVDYKNSKGSELLMKLYFGEMAEISRSIENIAGFRELMEQYHGEYGEKEKRLNPGTMTRTHEYYQYLALRHGQILVQAYIDWCDEATALLEKMDRGDIVTES